MYTQKTRMIPLRLSCNERYDYQNRKFFAPRVYLMPRLLKKKETALLVCIRPPPCYSNYNMEQTAKGTGTDNHANGSSKTATSFEKSNTEMISRFRKRKCWLHSTLLINQETNCLVIRETPNLMLICIFTWWRLSGDVCFPDSAWTGWYTEQLKDQILIIRTRPYFAPDSPNGAWVRIQRLAEWGNNTSSFNSFPIEPWWSKSNFETTRRILGSHLHLASGQSEIKFPVFKLLCGLL